MNKKKAFRSVVVVLLIATFLPTVAFADSITAYIDKGAVTITTTADNTGNVDYYDAGGTFQSGSYGVGDTVTITQTDSSVATSNAILVDTANGNAAAITLKDVNIKGNAVSEQAPVSIKGVGIDGGTVNVELDGSNILDASEVSNHAGLEVGNRSTIVIQDANSDGGSITAKGGQNSAGIGSTASSWGEITIESGNINATGGDGGAGVGSGYNGNSTTTITGGTVTATGGNNAAGIGTGHTGIAGVFISGGTVDATGGNNGAGIGAGNEGKTTVEISGGDVTAASSAGGAGVGSGLNGEGGVTITGGTVKATAGSGGAGVGTGENGRAAIKISGGDITATASTGTESVGAGLNGTATLEITGGTINGVNQLVEDNNSGSGGGSGNNGVDRYSIVLAPDTAFYIRDIAGVYVPYTAKRDEGSDSLSANKANNLLSVKTYIDGDELNIETPEYDVYFVFNVSKLRDIGVSKIDLKNGEYENFYELADFSGENVELWVEKATLSRLRIDGIDQEV